MLAGYADAPRRLFVTYAPLPYPEESGSTSQTRT
jgi:hypothetical protein